MQLPPTKKILREDVKDAPPWIAAIIEPVNSFMENVYQALNGNITFTQNVNSFVKELTYRTPSSYPVIDQVSFQNNLKVRATGVFLMQAFDKATYQPATGPVYVPWIEDNGNILVNSITGLAADKVYIIRLLIV